MSSYKENLKTIGALEIVREISSYLCYTGFSDTSGEWTITFTDGVSVWRTGLAERYVVELKVPLSQIRDCLHSGDVQASPAINSLALTLTCPQDSIDLNLLELSAADKKEEMKKLIFLLAGYVTTLQDNLNDYKLKLADAQRQRETTKQDTLFDLSGRSSGKVQTRPKKPAGHSLINPSTKRRKAAAGVVFGDEESED